MLIRFLSETRSGVAAVAASDADAFPGFECFVSRETCRTSSRDLLVEVKGQKFETLLRHTGRTRRVQEGAALLQVANKSAAPLQLVV